MTEMLQIIIPAGKDIKMCILDFLAGHDIENALIIGAIGSARDIRIAAPVEHELPLRTAEVPYNVACEIVGFTGEVMKWDAVDPDLAAMYPDKGDPLFVHIHVAAAMAGGHVFGGGFRGGKSLRSLRVFLLPL